jgi:5-methylcytosine-specific restriction endonuclease McrA
MRESYETQRENRRKRRARLAAAKEVATHTRLEWEVLKEIFQDRCVMCGRKGTEKDHILPLYRGGSDGVENLQPLCASCNCSKTGADADMRDRAYPRWREHYNKVVAILSSRLPDA